MKYVKVFHIPNYNEITLERIISIKNLIEENSQNRINFIPNGNNKTIRVEFIGDNVDEFGKRL